MRGACRRSEGSERSERWSVGVGAGAGVGVGEGAGEERSGKEFVGIP